MMNMKKAALYLLLTAAGVSTAVSQNKFGTLLKRAYPSLDVSTPQIILVTFTDKGGKNYAAEELLSGRSIRRRQKARPGHAVIDAADYPLEQSYVRDVAARVGTVRHQLKWFNAVSAVATKPQIDAIMKLPFVKEVDLVGRWKAAGPKEQLPRMGTKSHREGVTSLDYGVSYAQLQQINVPAVHNLGIEGQGVMICMFDEGVHNPSDPMFDSMRIVAMHDFVDHKESVIPEDPDYGGHGQATLTTIGGYIPGYFIGPAFRAEYLLARTENDSSETPIEEDNWAKGIEWADSIGVDVTSTSLVYLQFDQGWPSMTWQDMNGSTALITRAGDRADSLGIVVVNAAGNAGRDSTHNTLWAPADGFNIITVGAVDTAGVVMGFSSNGPTVDGRIKPDVMAMGMSGTSFACPLAAGVAALIRCANPDLTPAQVRDAMRNTASDAGSPDNFHGWGILDAFAAVNYFGITSHLSGTVYDDRNGDGKREPGEMYLPGVTVRIGGARTDSLLSDQHGRFLFDSLAGGLYTVTADHPGAGLITPGAAGYTVTIDSANRVTGNLDFGLFRPVSIRGRLYIDLNMDGIYDAGDATPAHWPVILSGSASATAYTDSNGYYSFTALGPGLYTVTDSLPPQWIEFSPGPGTQYSIVSVSGLDTTVPSFGNVFSIQSPVQVLDGWNLLSLPYIRSSFLRDSLFPGSVSGAFAYSDGYLQTDTLRPGNGYWLKFSGASVLSMTGYPIPAESIAIQARWNMIGSLSYPVPAGSVASIPPGIVTSPFYYYTGSGYALADTIRPGYGYWVKSEMPGVLILAPPGSAGKANRIRIAPGAGLPPPPPTAGGTPPGIPKIPDSFSLDQNYPNPFNPSTVIRYQLPIRSSVDIRVFDLLGREVAMLKNGVEQAGFKETVFDARNLPSGVYFVRLRAGMFNGVKKIVLAR